MSVIEVPAELELLVHRCRQDFAVVSAAWIRQGVHTAGEVQEMRMAMRAIFAGEIEPAARDEQTRYVCGLFARLAGELAGRAGQ